VCGGWTASRPCRHSCSGGRRIRIDFDAVLGQAACRVPSNRADRSACARRRLHPDLGHVAPGCPGINCKAEQVGNHSPHPRAHQLRDVDRLTAIQSLCQCEPRIRKTL
jgi:hypothetical protein